MTEYVYVKPNAGGRVRMPDRDNTVMPEAGQLVPRIDYYERLIITGDLVVAAAPKEKVEPKDAAAPAKAIPPPAKND